MLVNVNPDFVREGGGGVNPSMSDGRRAGLWLPRDRHDGDGVGKGDRFGLRVTDPSGAVVLELTFAPVALKNGSIKVGRL